MQYSKLVELYESLEKTTKRLEKTYIISKLLKKIQKEDIQQVIYLLQGLVFPPWDEHKLGMSSLLIVKALSSITGNSKEKVEKLWKKEGDLGLVSELLIKDIKQKTLMQKKLTTSLIFNNLRKLAELTGKGAINRKIQLLSELLANSRPLESKYIVKTVLNNLRIGIAEGIIRDAIVWAFFEHEIKFSYNEKENIFDVNREDYSKYIDAIQSAYDVTNDYGEIALIALARGLQGLKETQIDISKPINPMLAIRVESVDDALEALGTPVLCDLKLDGFRLLIHRKENKFWFYTRRLENVTKQFAELMPILNDCIKGSSYIIDSEVVGYDPKTKKYLPFQAISQRIKRKYNIEKIAKEVPVEINIFDIVYYNGKPLLEHPQMERRELLEKIVKEIPNKVMLTKKIISSDPREIQGFFDNAIRLGLEGVMVKNINTKYVSGRKVGGWIKLKAIPETLDLVITESDYGEGKRAKTLSSYTVSCSSKNKLLVVGKVSTGVKEKEGEFTYSEITKLLKPLIMMEEGKHVILKPWLVIEVAYEEIQRSPKYESGFALRFPKVLRIRLDKGVKDISALADIERIYKKQKGKR